MVGRRYSLVHRPGSYLINDTKDPNAPAEFFQVGDRSQAPPRYRQLEAHSTSARLHLAKGQAGTWVRRAGTSVRGMLPHHMEEGCPRAAGTSVPVPGLRLGWGLNGEAHALVPIVGVLSVGVLVAIMLIAVDSFNPESAAPEFSLGVAEVAAPTITAGSGDPPPADLEAQVDEVSASPRHSGRRRTSPRGGPRRCNRGTELGFANRIVRRRI